MRTRFCLAAAVVVSLLTSCGNAVDGVAEPTNPVESSGGSASESAQPDVTPSTDTSAADGAGECGGASSTAPCVGDRYEADGAYHKRMQAGHASRPFDLELEGVRVVAHENYDRIVLTFAGDGTPGFLVGYVNKAIAEGSGEVIGLDGGAILRLDIHGTPTQASGTTPPVRRTLAGDVVDLHGGVAWEGVTTVFLGIDGGRTPFRASVLTAPPRLVVDVK